jgi:pimeloyl-ACP methyl ester carboxylesterase
MATTDIAESAATTDVRESASKSHGVALTREEVNHAPREWAERTYNIKHWTELPTGGHFAASEEPKLLAEDIRAFFRKDRA